MKKYQKPETDIVLFSVSQSLMQVIETSGGTGNVGGKDNPEEPDLANQNPIWDTWGEEGN